MSEEYEPECMCGDEDCPTCFPYCWECGGDGSVILGHDMDNLDPLWDGPDGTVKRCPCCHGSGKAKDCTYW